MNHSVDRDQQQDQEARVQTFSERMEKFTEYLSQRAVAVRKEYDYDENLAGDESRTYTALAASATLLSKAYTYFSGDHTPEGVSLANRPVDDVPNLPKMRELLQRKDDEELARESKFYKDGATIPLGLQIRQLGDALREKLGVRPKQEKSH